MPPQPNMQQMLKQAQKMQAEMMAAQETLKDERVEASAGGGMVKVVATGELRSSRSRSTPTRSTPRTSRCCRTCARRGQRGAALRPQELRQPSKMRRAFDPAALGAASAAAAWRRRLPAAAGGASNRAAGAKVVLAPPVQRLVTELGKLPGIGDRTAQRLAFHVLRASHGGRATRSPTRSARSRSKITLCEICFNLAEGPRCTICADERRDADADLRRRGAGRRDPDRAHARVPRPLPRARRRAVADRRRRARGPQDRRSSTRASRRAGRSREVVLATNPTTTGEATALHIADGLRMRAPDVAVTRLASGLPVGGDLEYADEVTLGRALAGRRAV